jgi:hypothetical protein
MLILGQTPVPDKLDEYHDATTDHTVSKDIHKFPGVFVNLIFSPRMGY